MFKNSIFKSSPSINARKSTNVDPFELLLDAALIMGYYLESTLGQELKTSERI